MPTENRRVSLTLSKDLVVALEALGHAPDAVRARDVGAELVEWSAVVDRLEQLLDRAGETIAMSQKWRAFTSRDPDVRNWSELRGYLLALESLQVEESDRAGQLRRLVEQIVERQEVQEDMAL